MTDNSESKSSQLQTQINQIEANLAFFDARFALIEHKPDTAYKRAQLRAYQIMQEQLKSELEELQMQFKLRQARKQPGA